MATIEKTGIYRIGEGVGADYVQLKAGTDVPDDYAAKATYVEAWPEPGQPLGAKATDAPENKKQAAPDNKGA